MFSIENQIFSRVLKGTAAAGIEQVMNIIIQLISVPLFLKYWGVTVYGEWLLLFTLPAYLAVSDLGFTKAAVNSMTLSYAEKNYDDANRFYHTCFLLLLVLGLITLGSIALILYSIPEVHVKLNFETLNSEETSTIIIVLSIYILLFQQAELLRGVISASGKFYYSMTLVGVYRFLEFVIIAVLVIYNFGPLHVAFVYIALQLLMISHLVIYIIIKLKWAHLGVKSTVKYTSRRALNGMLKPALAFMMLPVGFAFRTQFPVFLIGLFFNPAAIVAFTAVRTITSAGSQIIGAINKAITPEYALAFGAGNLKLVRSIHHNSCNIAFSLSVFLFVFLILFGELIINIWTHNTIALDYQLFITFLLSLVVNSLWSTSSYLSYSINRHTRQSLYFLVFCVSGGGLTYLILKYLGFSCAALGILVADILMLLYVLIQNKEFLDEGNVTFLKNVFKLPSLSTIRNIKNALKLG